LITSVVHGADFGFLAVNPQVTLVINPVVGCCSFPPGLLYPVHRTTAVAALQAVE